MKDNPLNRLKVLRGSQLPHAKLTEHDVALILGLIARRQDLLRKSRELSNVKIAEKFGVSHYCIDKISAGEAWIHVQGAA